MWDEQLPILRSHSRVIGYDARGSGRPGPADTAYQAHTDLYALLQHLAVGRVSLVGVSLGGRIAIDFALNHPDMVDKLVLAGPGLSGWRDWSAEDTTWHITAPRARHAPHSIWVGVAWVDSRSTPPASG